MRKVLVILGAFLASACSAVPAPQFVTERIAGLDLSHPVSWSATPGPARLSGGGPIPVFYLSNATLSVEPCPEQTSQSFDGCRPPITTLPAGGVLVTFSDAGNVAQLSPPVINAGGPTDSWSGQCKTLDGDRQVYSALDGLTVLACLRGPNVDANEAAVRAMIASMNRPE